MDQDWTPVVIRPKKQQNKTQATRAAQQSSSGASGASAPVQTQKKAAPANKQRSADRDVRKLDNDDGEEAGYEVKTVGLAIGRKIQQARQAKGWTQKELAEQIQEKQVVVQQYENGKAMPNQKIISKFEKALGANVRS